MSELIDIEKLTLKKDLEFISHPLDTEKHKKAFEEGSYQFKEFQKIKTDYDQLETNEEKIEFIFEVMDGKLDGLSTTDAPLMITLINSINRGLDLYVSEASCAPKSGIFGSIIRGVVIRMTEDDENNSFWANMYNSDAGLYALHDAVDSKDFMRVKKLLETSPREYRLITKEIPRQYNTQALTALHHLLMLDDVNDSKKVELMKCFIAAKRVSFENFVANYNANTLLKTAMQKCGLPVFQLLTQDEVPNDIIMSYAEYKYAAPIDPSVVNEYEFLFDIMGRNIKDYINKVQMENGEDIDDCGGTLFFKKQIFECRKRDWARLLSVLTNEKMNQMPEIHFHEEIVTEVMTKWISIQEYLSPKRKRTLRDSIPARDNNDKDESKKSRIRNGGDLIRKFQGMRGGFFNRSNPDSPNGSYDPIYDFNDDTNPHLKRARLVQFCVETGLDSDYDIREYYTDEDLIEFSRNEGSYKGEYPTMEEIYENRKKSQRYSYEKSWEWVNGGPLETIPIPPPRLRFGRARRGRPAVARPMMAEGAFAFGTPAPAL
eukprot:TRINITY_DN106_c0_g1_i2.p1 TRINITY_DN106_c0_g1~~TRINITY_DN106_c0_g1_i2.p1  ORF type:complete len:544 (+),score=138.28 TRINITY_DN106_c0_g1_i2:152-1783(+)